MRRLTRGILGIVAVCGVANGVVFLHAWRLTHFGRGTDGLLPDAVGGRRRRGAHGRSQIPDERRGDPVALYSRRAGFPTADLQARWSEVADPGHPLFGIKTGIQSRVVATVEGGGATWVLVECEITGDEGRRGPSFGETGRRPSDRGRSVDSRRGHPAVVAVGGARRGAGGEGVSRPARGGQRRPDT